MKHSICPTSELFSNSSLPAGLVIRSALDIGSRDTKLTVASVDTETYEIAKIYYENFISVELREDLLMSTNTTLSNNIQIKLIAALKKMQQETKSFQVKQWTSIGTSVFRNAQNSEKFLRQVEKETRIGVNVISQKEEGEIGFFSAIATSKKSLKDVVSWDMGSGSFQISALVNDQLEVYGAEFSLVPALGILCSLREKSFISFQNLNPIDLSEASILTKEILKKLPPVPDWLYATNKQCIAIGGITSIFSIGQIATRQFAYQKHHIWQSITELCGKTDEELGSFPNPSEVITSLVLVHLIMDHCQIEQVSYFPTNGNCEGLLVMPKYWPK